MTTMDKETFVTPYYEVKGFSPTEKLFVMTDLHGCSQAMSRLLKHYDGQSKSCHRYQKPLLPHDPDTGHWQRGWARRSWHPQSVR